MDELKFNFIFGKGFKALTPDKFKELSADCKKMGYLGLSKHFEAESKIMINT